MLIRAQKVMEKYDLKPRDAIHAAAAIGSGQSEMISDDSTFDKVKEVRRKPL